MPNRIVREGILTSRRVAALTPSTELFYRKLMNVVDDHGRFEADPVIIKSRCYPFVEGMPLSQIEAYLKECASGEYPLLQTYRVGNKTFLELDNFGQQIRSKSKYPGPPTSLNSPGLIETTVKVVSANKSASPETNCIHLASVAITNTDTDTHTPPITNTPPDTDTDAIQEKTPSASRKAQIQAQVAEIIANPRPGEEGIAAALKAGPDPEDEKPDLHFLSKELSLELFPDHPGLNNDLSAGEKAIQNVLYGFRANPGLIDKTIPSIRKAHREYCAAIRAEQEAGNKTYPVSFQNWFVRGMYLARNATSIKPANKPAYVDPYPEVRIPRELRNAS